MSRVICPRCNKEMSRKDNSFVCEVCENGISVYDVEVEKSIMGVLEDEKVCYRNEFRYRLEKTYYHTVTDYALRRLEEGKPYNEGLKLARTQLPGRRVVARGTANVFYKEGSADYESLVLIMKKKLDLSTFVSELAPSAGFYAQELWRDAFKDIGYEIVKEDVQEYDGKKATVKGDIDFIAKKDGLLFGVEVKNGLEYCEDLAKKVQIAIELGTIPVLVVRRVTWDVYQKLKKFGVLTKLYETSVMPTAYESLVEECKKILGMPLIALDAISPSTREHLQNKVMVNAFGDVDGYKHANKVYLEAVRSYRKRMEALDKELRFV